METALDLNTDEVYAIGIDLDQDISMKRIRNTADWFSTVSGC